MKNANETGRVESTRAGGDLSSGKTCDAPAVETARGLSVLLEESIAFVKRLPVSVPGRSEIGTNLERARLWSALLSGGPAERSEAERGAVQIATAIAHREFCERHEFIGQCVFCALEVVQRLRDEASRLQQLADLHQRRNAELETETARQREEMLEQAALIAGLQHELKNTISAVRLTARERDTARSELVQLRRLAAELVHAIEGAGSVATAKRELEAVIM